MKDDAPFHWMYVDYDFEADTDWVVTGVEGADNGAWEIGTPCGNTTRGAPGNDFDGSGRCYLTGAGDCDSNTDIDNGCTTLTTSIFSAVNPETLSARLAADGSPL